MWQDMMYRPPVSGLLGGSASAGSSTRPAWADKIMQGDGTVGAELQGPQSLPAYSNPERPGVYGVAPGALPPSNFAPLPLPGTPGAIGGMPSTGGPLPPYSPPPSYSGPGTPSNDLPTYSGNPAFNRPPGAVVGIGVGGTPGTGVGGGSANYYNPRGPSPERPGTYGVNPGGMPGGMPRPQLPGNPGAIGGSPGVGAGPIGGRPFPGGERPGTYGRPPMRPGQPTNWMPRTRGPMGGM